MEDDAVKLDNYKLQINEEVVDINIFKDKDGFMHYTISVKNISKHTSIVLDKIKEEFVSEVSVGKISMPEEGEAEDIKEQLREELLILVKKYFPNATSKTSELLVNELIRQNVGLGDIEVLLKDPQLEEIVINRAEEPVWVYHKRFGWLKTNIIIPSEDKIRHYSTMIGRDVGKEITNLKPLMDAHLLSGDRVNATLKPISSSGNTITIRKFATKPWTITDFIRGKTIDYRTAALLWLAIQNELSVLITGGTGSGKTSMLNVASSFIPINQRVISIEDTRELVLPKDLHWVPMETRLPNPEGKGEVTMLDLVVNSLRMRPDRIIMGEVRRKEEAEVLFEAMHTGHSVYATLHANDVEDTIQRLVNPPIDVPKALLPAISLILVVNRNRVTGRRRVWQLAEIMPDGEPRIIMQYNVLKDSFEVVNKPLQSYKTLSLYTGMDEAKIEEDIKEKIQLLKWLVENNVNDVHDIGGFFRRYYVHKWEKEGVYSKGGI